MTTVGPSPKGESGKDRGVLVIRGDARCLPLSDNSVDLIVTSPPYFALRSYQDGGEHYAGQVGDEATPAEFVDALIACTAEWMRVLKPSGSLWVNLGDKYAGSANEKPHTGTAGIAQANQTRNVSAGRPAPITSARAKSLIGIPWRYALRCIDDLGLILRAEVIWSKPNGLPESVTDRVRRSHEQWFHMVREPRYYSAVDEIREQHATADAVTRIRSSDYAGGMSGNMNGAGNPLGKLPGSVWSIPTQPLQVPASLGIDHFAAFPMEWPRRIIKGWSPSGICTACGEGRVPAVATDLGRKERDTPQYDSTGRARHGTGSSTLGSRGASAVITGEVCACKCSHEGHRGEGQYREGFWLRPGGTISEDCPQAPTRPSVVLDPFGGTGTTALVASTLGRIGISNDLSHDYSRLAGWRTTDRGERARAMQVEKPKPEVPGQGELWEASA